MAKKKEEKVYKIDEELLKEVTTEDTDVVDPDNPKRPKEKF